jgi:hypothetical protein
MSNDSQSYPLSLFHGTDDVSSENILMFGFKVPDKTRDDHWLGSGIYFYREDCEQAYLWALNKFKSKTKTKEFHVLESLIIINEDNFLNLDSRKGFSYFSEFARFIHSESQKKMIEFEDNPIKIRNFIMNLLPKKYLVIQRTFKVKSLIFDNEEVLNKMELCLQGVQVCIRDKKVITGDIILRRVEPKLVSTSTTKRLNNRQLV